MPQPRFRFVCSPSALRGAPSGWAKEMLREGEIALLGDEGLEAIDALAHELDQVSILLLRSEQDGIRQDASVMSYAAALPLVWVAPQFGPDADAWARGRGPMTLLSTSSGPLSDEERRRIDRFVAILSRQSE